MSAHPVWPHRSLALALFCGVLAASLVNAAGEASAFPPPEGPALSVPEATLAKGVRCTSDLATTTRNPVLLTPAFSTDDESFSSYLRQLPALGIAICAITTPERGFEDLQTAAEYVVHAVRMMSDASGRKVVLFGHQHGPLDELWALTFWPDLPERVSDLISLATPYQGTLTATAWCAKQSCPASVWQIATGSQFLGALNARDVPEGPSYTSITSRYDELILPQPAASSRQGVTTIVLQDVCPDRFAEHFTILTDYLAYQLVIDSIEHPGEAADPARLSADVCEGPQSMPTPSGSDYEQLPPRASEPQDQGGFPYRFATYMVTKGLLTGEPSLRPYAAE